MLHAEACTAPVSTINKTLAAVCISGSKQWAWTLLARAGTVVGDAAAMPASQGLLTSELHVHAKSQTAQLADMAGACMHRDGLCSCHTGLQSAAAICSQHACLLQPAARLTEYSC